MSGGAAPRVAAAPGGTRFAYIGERLAIPVTKVLQTGRAGPNYAQAGSSPFDQCYSTDPLGPGQQYDMAGASVVAILLRHGCSSNAQPLIMMSGISLVTSVRPRPQSRRLVTRTAAAKIGATTAGNAAASPARALRTPSQVAPSSGVQAVPAC